MATKTKQPIIPDVKAVDSALVRPEGTAFNPMQDLQRSQIAAQNAGLPSGGFTPPTVPTTFNAGDLGKTQRPVVPPEVTAPAPDNTSAYLNGINTATQTADKIAQERRAALDKQFAPLDQQQQQITKNIQGIADNKVSSQQTYDTAFQKALNESGDPEVQKKLADLNIQIAQRTADYNTKIASLPGQGRGITTGIVAGQTDRERRLAAVEIGNLATLKLAYQDNIQAAKDTALQTVNFMFQDEERDLRNQQALLNANEGSYNRLEKKQADERQQIIQDRLDAIKDKKDELTQIQNLAIDAAKNKAPADIAQKMASANSIEEAMSIGSQYLSEKEKRSTAVVEIGGKQKLIDTQTGETVKELGASTEAELKLENLRLENQKARVELGLAPLGNAGATADLNTFMEALSGQESGGDYNAQNGRTNAFGRFQIMPANWPSWSREAGLPDGAQQTPENQDKVAQFKLNQYYQKYGNWADVASVWYSGKPFSQVEAEGWADRKQGNGDEPSVREYVNSVLSKLPTKTVKLKQDDAAKLNKEIAASDTYKAIIKAQDAINALDNFSEVFTKQGGDLETFGLDAGKLKQAHKDTLLVLKEYFNLGVLNGPDQTILEEVLPNPTNFGLRFYGGADAVSNGIDTMRNRIFQTLNDRKADLNTAYQDYSVDQLSNLQNAERIANQLLAKNEMIVIDRATGQKGTIQRNEFDSDLYEEVK